MTVNGEVRDFEDSREKLEADVLSESASWLHTPYGFRKVCNWLDRQAAITRREYSGVDWFAIIHNLRDEIAELEDKVDRLTAERDEAVEAYDAHMAAHDAWHEAEDIKYTRNRFAIYEQATKERVARLESERDALAHDLAESETLCSVLRNRLSMALDLAHEITMLQDLEVD